MIQSSAEKRTRKSFVNARPFVEKELETLAGFKWCKKNGEVLLEKIEPDRAALAHLRKALGKTPNKALTAFHSVVGWTQDFENEWEVECYFLVASLFGLYQRGEMSQSWHHDKNLRDEQRNFGASFRRFEFEEAKKNGDNEPNKERSKSLEKRFTALLNSRSADLSVRLRHAVLLLKSNQVPIDWVQLLKDLLQWKRFDTFATYRSRGVSPQRKWAQSFWRLADFETEED